MNKYFLFSLFAVVLCGCTTVTQVSEKKYPPTDPAKVEILYESPQRPHEVIGLVSYSGGKGLLGGDTKHLIENCKEGAAQLGADAVIVSSLELSGIGRRAKISGTAIKWK